eukprot:CAMPEP_0167755044 /NCGR_PEP_ID=MMETSP0110_2-20121227/8605_1 /TAXON_ID=629695 /ORGANISM="Gymnochlora sp., Strain CCMP2014" /LENGTH=675 /DNA_ID=CAMNT_0007640987 /DNA_START=29 /DNA_END=2056 /DNA_ORIENTATION=+
MGTSCGCDRSIDEEKVETLLQEIKNKDALIEAQKREIEALKSGKTEENMDTLIKNDSSPKKCSLTILHFNDVYNIEPMNEYQGGAARFMSMVKSFDKDKPLILFSGDAFNPSVLSTVTHGKQMPPVLNKIGVHVACYGNHDFDFGMEAAMKLTGATKFPWLLSNIVNAKTGKPLAGAKEYTIITHNGHRIGIFAVADNWTDTMPNTPEDGIKYIPYVEKAKEIVKILKEKKDLSLIVALTHSRLPSDVDLCEKVEGIDLVLGGHDHLYTVKSFPKTKAGIFPPVLVKSGSDFRDLSQIEVFLDSKLQHPDIKIGGNAGFRVTRCRVGKNVTEDPDMLDIVEAVSKDTEELFNSPLGTVEVDLDASFKVVRSRECPVGNLLADVARRAYEVKGGVQVGYIVGGTIRSDSIYPKGTFTYKQVLRMLPFQDNTVVVRLTGAQLLATIEHGLSSYPKLDGRFPHVSGLSLVFDPKKEPGSRIVSIQLHDSEGIPRIPLDEKASYTVATREYLFRGGDGYTELAKGEAIVDEENGHPLSFLLRNFFWKVRELNTTAVIEKRLGENTKKKRMSLRLDKVQSISMMSEGIEKKKDSAPTPVSSSPNQTDFMERMILIHPKVEGRVMTLEQAKEAKGGKPRKSDDLAQLPPFSGMTREMERESIIRTVVERQKSGKIVPRSKF